MDKGIETLRKDLIDLIDYSLDTARLYGYADADLNHSEDDYKRGYDDACFDYNRGLADGRMEAWECARKIGKVNWLTLEEMGFVNKDKEKNPSWDVVMEYSASEAIAKIKAYEERQKQKQDAEIKVGDEVVGDYGATGVVVGIETYKGEVLLSLLMGSYKTPQIVKASRYKTKTGRHFPQIIEVLEQIKGETDGK